MKPRWVVVAVSLLLPIAAVPPAPAEGDDKVQVTVLAILASSKNNDIDPKLKTIAEKVRERVKKDEGVDLTGFKLARTTRKSLVQNQSMDFPLIADEVVAVVVEHGADDKNRVGLKVKPPQLGEISYTSCCGKFFPIVTSYKNKDDQRLIIAIMVEPCGK